MAIINVNKINRLSVGNFNESSTLEDILLWLRDFGIPKIRGFYIAERILKAYKP